MQKNDIYEIEIEDMSDDGAGIGHVDGMAVFVKDTAPGDTAEIKIIKVKKSYAFGRLMQLIKPSEDRVEAPCEVARQCGGCTLQHVNYNAQLRLKRNKVENCLKRIGGIENASELCEEVLGMEDNPFRFRNKMQFPIGKDRDGNAVLGFYAQRTHSIIPIEDCMTGHGVNKYIIDVVKDYINKNKISVYDEEKGTGLLRHLITRIGFTTGELMVALVINGDDVPEKAQLVKGLEEAVQKYEEEACAADGEKKTLYLTSVMLNINKENTNRIIGFESKRIFGRDFIYDYIGDVRFRISVESFFQVNPYQTGRLYGKALEYAGLTGEETVWDMYCGIGTISLFLSKKAKKVYGVEIVPQAIEDARGNAELNQITNTDFFVGKAEDVVTDIYSSGGDGSHADVVVVDPPRKGCDGKLLDTLISMKPERIVYVSCDPATLARDIKILSEEGGYTLNKYSVCDMFSHSGHVETVALLSRILDKSGDI
ncbi:MAG: 23S rRNA (uracil(1939)-C(5))-methyltransferase RlmD [Eubacterium sp.]|nr:23S rRNA (uracil(1939)-C(5))-methyltransferase RlmD [Eubacterium sp.]